MKLVKTIKENLISCIEISRQVSRCCLRNKLLREKHGTWREIDIGFELSGNKKVFSFFCSSAHLFVTLEGLFPLPLCGMWSRPIENLESGIENSGTVGWILFFWLWDHFTKEWMKYNASSSISLSGRILKSNWKKKWFVIHLSY